jgi:hypothetical protein
MGAHVSRGAPLLVSAGVATLLIALRWEGGAPCESGSSAAALNDFLIFTNIAVAAIGLLIATRFLVTGRGAALWRWSLLANALIYMAGVAQFGVACSA